MNIGITGADGLIGWHIRAYAKAHRPDITLSLATRATFADAALLQQFVGGCDAIIHCAGVNRGTDEAVTHGNIHAAQMLADAAAKSAAFPHILYTNSTHSVGDTAYGRSKRRAAEILAKAASGHGGLFTNFILPHVFGEGGKPFYNSAVSTFCHQLAIGEQPAIIHDGMLQLVHAQSVAQHILAAIATQQHGTHEITGHKITVSALLTKLLAMHTQYADQRLIPHLDDPFDLALFNTLRSYRYPLQAQVPLALRSDARGHLFEAVRTLHGGQAFMSTTHPGITRGNHFHTQKIERFLVCAGEAEIRIRKLFSNEITVFTVSGNAPSYIDMPTFHTHSITNTGTGELVTLFWAHELFDPQTPDTFAEAV
jgi:UDP-2-acetamido-2,6-beta-L-arabino-hexul-4-ose reductase